MNIKKLGIVINYCSNDHIFIDALLQQCSMLEPGQIVVSIGDHLYDMTPEDMDHITELASQYPNVQFTVYDVKPMSDERIPLQRKGAYWHNIARIAGCKKLNPDIEWVLLLDADEIPDAHAFSQWYAQLESNQYIYKLANYWYFLKPTYQATSWEDSIMLLPRAACCYVILMNSLERDGIPDMCQLTCVRDVVHHASKLPMFHHYSWVRSKSGLLQKVKSWGHKHDDDWLQKIENTYTTTENGDNISFNCENDLDFVHGYQYKEVANIFNIDINQKLSGGVTTDTS